MTIQDIITIPDPLLRTISRPVVQIDNHLLSLLDSMAETMYDASGIGLAGVQIAKPLRILTVDVSTSFNVKRLNKNTHTDNEEENELYKELIFLINPEIVSLGDEVSVYEEGCLSIPEYSADVERPSTCVVEYLDRQGIKQTLEADGLLSTCLQHEVDHLNGILFIDHISRLKRDMVIKKFNKKSRKPRYVS